MRSKRPLITLGFLIALGLPAYFLLSRWANTPVSQSISVVPSSATSQASSNQAIDTVYFHTVAPPQWRVQKEVDKAHPDKLHVVAFASSGSSGQMAITTDTLPSDQLAGVADYHLRTSDTTHYATFTSSSLPQSAKAFKSTSGTPEYTVFMVDDGRYASITVSAMPSDDQSLETLFSAVSSWRWIHVES